MQVQDTGVGMRKEASLRLFEPFYQAQSSSGTGTGLGLYSVRMHSEALGGHCGYLEVPHGKGSIFYFEVPLLCEEDCDAGMTETEAPSRQMAPAVAAASTNSAKWSKADRPLPNASRSSSREGMSHVRVHACVRAYVIVCLLILARACMSA